MAEKKEVIGKITLLNVRASFLSIFEVNRQKQDDGTVRETYKANGLISKQAIKDGTAMAVYKGKKMPVLEAIKAASDEVKAKKWGSPDKWPKIKADRKFFRDGDEEDWEGYAGHWYVSANCAPDSKPSVVINQKDGDGKWIKAQPGGEKAPYSGCFINLSFTVWAQDNEHGKRINARLRSVQWFAKGEAFGQGPVDPNDDFDDEMVGEEGEFDGGDDGSDDASDLV